MKKDILLIILVLISVNLFGENVCDLEGKRFCSADFEFVYFQDNKIVIGLEDSLNDKKWFTSGKYDYLINEENELSFLNIYTTSKIYRYLIVYNDEILIMYDSDNSRPFFFGYTKGVNRIECIYTDIERWFDASSYLTENDYEYKASNLASLKTKEPWVEGKQGDGIGEKIFISTYGKALYILNGFYSYNKPYLWEQNSRVKKIRIHFTTNPEYPDLDIELKDTSRLQKFIILPNFKDVLGTQKMELEILEVYPGSKYHDTCINGIIVSAVD